MEENTMNIQLQNITGRLPEGEYTGTITEATVSMDIKYLWLKIQVDGTSNETLNISMPINSVLFDKFARCFSEDLNVVNTDDFVNTMIKFTLKDRESLTGEIYSKFVKILPFFEDEEENNNDNETN